MGAQDVRRRERQLEWSMVKKKDDLRRGQPRRVGCCAFRQSAPAAPLKEEEVAVVEEERGGGGERRRRRGEDERRLHQTDLSMPQ
jgi:hypothetical protein